MGDHKCVLFIKFTQIKVSILYEGTLFLCQFRGKCHQNHTNQQTDFLDIRKNGSIQPNLGIFSMPLIIPILLLPVN